MDDAYTSSIPDHATPKTKARVPNRTEYFVDGEKVGERVFFAPGRLQYEASLRHGRRHGWQYTWHDNGRLATAAPYEDGLPHGTASQWGDDGTLWGTYTMERGTGVDLWWTRIDGTVYLAESHPMRDGCLHGIQRWWRVDGALADGYPKFWVRGEEVDRAAFDAARADDATLPAYDPDDDRPSVVSVEPGWAAFHEVAQALERGDFAALDPLFVHPSPIVAWHRCGWFDREPIAFAEALTCACFWGRTEIAGYLDAAGASQTNGDGTGKNALQWAVDRGHLAIVELLLPAPDILDARTPDGDTALALAVRHARAASDDPNRRAILSEMLAADPNRDGSGFPTGVAWIDALLSTPPDTVHVGRRDLPSPGRDARRDALIARIRDAFADVRRTGGVSLHETDVIDRYGTDAERTVARARDKDTRWWQVPDEDMARNSRIFPFLDTIGWRYYLPAYMTLALRRIDDSSDSLLYALERSDFANALDQAQSEAVCAFLRFLAEEVPYGLFDSGAVYKALATHWWQFDENQGD